MKQNSWVCTLATQISLCFALYLAFKVGQPQEAFFQNGGTSESIKPFDFYFISVAGDFRPQNEQTLLLRQMAKVAELFKAQFVVSISELGQDDSLRLNGTRYFRSLKVPWYTTKSFDEQGAGHYLKCTKIPYGKTLDIVFVNTQLFQGISSDARKTQLSWLTKTLERNISDWCIVVGFHPLSSCNVTTEGEKSSDSLHHILLNYGVDAYLSGDTFRRYISVRTAEQLIDASPMTKGPCITPVNKLHPICKEAVDGFFLHRVGSFEFVTYLLSLNGEVIQKIEQKQIGKEVM
ncbi:OLC1v1035601C1 [Oldenlandia corymbosa var. corymbosa]|uniref:OLC1v1035601C1 n=1 Tax=Oldenlandia corymbosa var. corymbosa TaxID=529605 RepID=A0AAV1CUJ2_OLDCO|nr:OLC1v1035601C1 [Oldenlandia corymbosa var. corymbosa]